MLGDWDGAKRSLQDVDDPVVPRLTALLTEQQRRERERAEMQAVARHELANAISIAQANMEALVDGVLEATPERLASIRDAMITCGVLLEDFKKQARQGWQTRARMAVFDVCELISSQVDLVRGIAESKKVHVRYDVCSMHANAPQTYRGDPDLVALIVRDVLLGAVRFTPPGGSVGITCPGPGGEIELRVSGDPANNDRERLGFSLASKFLEALDGHASIITDDPNGTKFVLRIPAVSC